MPDSSTKELVHRFLDWGKVDTCLKEYKHIGALFDIGQLKACENVPPYYCHYLAWRLGHWDNPQWVAFFDRLLASADNLPGWKGGKGKTVRVHTCSKGTAGVAS